VSSRPADPFLYLARTGIRPGLERIRTLLGAMGHPERSFRSVLVAGSNGKGTTAAALEAMLRAAGCRTGLFTSPHLVSVTERFRIDGRPVSPAELHRFLSRHRHDLRRSGATYFEATTACALWLFARRQVDWAILEIGLGGRWDACNAVDPELAVVTSISLEHTEYLGRTEAAIAREKAQVARRGKPVVVGRVSPPARCALAREFDRIGAPAYWLGRDFDVTDPGPIAGGSEGTLIAQGRRLRLRSGVRGERALDNVALAACGMATLAGHFPGFSHTEMRRAMLAGAARVRWPARLEVIRQRPLVVLDVAHNEAAFAALVQDWARYWPGVKPVVVLGLLCDKPAARIARIVSRLTDLVVVTTPDSPRAVPASELADSWRSSFRSIHVRKGVTAAVEHALELAGSNGAVLITGSHFVVGPARASLLD
jgi:dihydrofolate synthase/folylpolyglutamate synthase